MRRKVTNNTSHEELSYPSSKLKHESWILQVVWLCNIAHKFERITRTKYQPSSPRDQSLSPPATLHCLQNIKWLQGVHKMAVRVCIGVNPSVLGCSNQLFQALILSEKYNREKQRHYCLCQLLYINH